MYICMYTCMYICMYVYMHVYMYRIRSNFRMKMFTKISKTVRHFRNIFSYNLIMAFNYHNDIDSKMENYPSKLHNILI